jgi:amino acid permease
MLTVVTLSVGFGEITLMAYGKKLESTPLITSQLPNGNAWVWTVKILFCFNLIFSYPLVIYPANTIIEGYLYRGMPKSRKRQMLKNITRSIMVLFTVVVAITLGTSLAKFLSILGAVACTPIAFTLPCLFHYHIVAKTICEKAIDIIIIIFSLIVFAFCSFWTLYNWNDS